MSEPFELTAGELGQQRLFDGARATLAGNGCRSVELRFPSQNLVGERRVVRELREVDGCERLPDIGRRSTS